MRIEKKNQVGMVTAGIDVGGPAKGYHLALVEPARNKVLSLHHSLTAAGICDYLRPYEKGLGAVAIDAPSKKWIRSSRTRQAERELCGAGYRIQWTRRKKADAPPWMQMGETIWRRLGSEFKRLPVIETFPTALCDRLEKCSLQLPLRLLPGKKEKKQYADYLDAALCAWAASRYLEGSAEMFGVRDCLNPVYI